jgi:hypothetical protein
MKYIGAPFTHICEWKRSSPSFGSFGSLGWTLVVVTVALGSASMIFFPLYGFDLESEPTSDSEAFILTTNDFFEQHSSVLCQGILWNSHHFSVYFFVFSLPFFVLAWTSCPKGVHPFSVLCSMGWGQLFPTSAVRNLHIQTLASYV